MQRSGRRTESHYENTESRYEKARFRLAAGVSGGVDGSDDRPAGTGTNFHGAL